MKGNGIILLLAAGIAGYLFLRKRGAEPIPNIEPDAPELSDRARSILAAQKLHHLFQYYIAYYQNKYIVLIRHNKGYGTLSITRDVYDELEAAGMKVAPTKVITAWREWLQDDRTDVPTEAEQEAAYTVPVAPVAPDTGDKTNSTEFSLTADGGGSQYANDLYNEGNETTWYAVSK